MRWTVERVELLKKLWADGYSGSQIAVALGGVTRNGVIGKAHRLGLGDSSRGGAPRIIQPRRELAARPAAAPGRRPLRMLAAAPQFMEAEAVMPDPADVAIPFPQRRTLLALTAQTCRWPIGDPARADFFFCGGEVCGDGPYCAYHHRVAYVPLDRRRQDKFNRFMERAS